MKKLAFTLIFLFLLVDIVYPASRDEVMKISSFFSSNYIAILSEIKKTDTKTPEGKLKAAILYNAISVKTNDGKSYYEAIKLLEEYVKVDRDSFALTYLAMANAFVARYGIDPSTKTLYSNKAIDIFKEAVSKSPNEWFIRFLRGQVLFEFPDFFKVSSTVREDFEFLKKLVDKGEITDPSVLVSIYYFLGEIEKGTGNINKAIEYWKKSVQTAETSKLTDSDEYKKSKKRLEIFLD